MLDWFQLLSNVREGGASLSLSLVLFLLVVGIMLYSLRMSESVLSRLSRRGPTRESRRDETGGLVE